MICLRKAGGQMMRMEITDRVSRAGVYGGTDSARLKEARPAAAQPPVSRTPVSRPSRPAAPENIREFEEYLMEIGLRF